MFASHLLRPYTKIVYSKAVRLAVSITLFNLEYNTYELSTASISYLNTSTRTYIQVYYVCIIHLHYVKSQPPHTVRTYRNILHVYCTVHTVYNMLI